MNFNCLKFKISDFFFENRKQIIIISSLFFVGILTGIITMCQLKSNFGIDKIADAVLKDSLCGRVGFWAYFFRRVLEYVVAGAFCLLLSLNFYSSFLIYIFMFYRGYILGATIVLCAELLGLGGSINVVIFYIPLQLALNFVLICFASKSMNIAFNRHRYGKCYTVDYSFVYVYLILVVALSLLEAIFLPPLLKNVIYNA